MEFAAGKFALGICDRCGWEYKYLKLKLEWNGLLVCSTCYEEKHSQLYSPRHVSDREVLENPRPARPEGVTVSPGGTGWSGKKKKDLTFKFEIGKVSVTIS